MLDPSSITRGPVVFPPRDFIIQLGGAQDVEVAVAVDITKGTTS